MRTVIDTNILVSALITSNTPPDMIYRAWMRGEIEVVTCNAQLDELARVLSRPRLRGYLDPEEARLILDNLDTRAVILADPPAAKLSPDPQDNRILAAAIAGGADLIITGDKRHLLFLGEAAGIPIVTAREALKRLQVQ